MALLLFNKSGFEIKTNDAVELFAFAHKMNKIFIGIWEIEI